MANKGGGLKELKELLQSAAFPFIIQIVFGASVILFTESVAELALRAVILIFGEALLIGAYIIFGRQNGIAAMRKKALGDIKRENGEDSGTAGEYAVWKGAVIALLSVIPYCVLQFLECVAHTTFFEFVLKYAFGWAEYPFFLIGQAAGKEFSQWLNFIWVLVPVAVHTAAYVWGATKEDKRRKVAAANGKAER